MYTIICIYFALYIFNTFLFQVYVGSKSTLAEGTNFGSARGTENEVTEMEVRILRNGRKRITCLFYVICIFMLFAVDLFSFLQITLQSKL